MLESVDDNVPIIFIWIGELPEWILQSLLFVRKSNRCRQVYLLTNSKLLTIPYEIASVVHLTDFYIDNISNKLPKLKYSGEFWKRSSMRFFVLEDFVRVNKIEEFYHAEIDNAVFNLTGLNNKLNHIGKGIFVPRDSKNRAIASLIYCNRPESLTELTDLYQSTSPPEHDMDALGMYANTFNNFFHALPTESFLENSLSWPIISPQNLGGIFDAAAIGQYLLGADPIHSPFKPCKNGIVNENCKVDLKSVNFIAKNTRIFIRFQSSSTEFEIYNIHLHSKNFPAFNEIMNTGKILTKLNMGEISIISNHHMVFLGPIFFAAHKLVNSINRVLRKTRQWIFSDD